MSIILLNKEWVVFELMEITRLKIARELRINAEAVDATVYIKDDGKLKVELAVKPEAVKFRDVNQVQDVMKRNYLAARTAAQLRMVNIDQRWSDGKEAQAQTAPAE